MSSANPIAIDLATSANKAAAIVSSRKRHTDASPIRLNFANFNQDFSCISVGYNDSYRVYNCEPFGQCYSRHDGSIGIVEMLFTSSLLALVGTGEQDALSPRRLRVINTKRQTTICELTFPDTILAVKMNRERLIVLLEGTIYVYDINNMRLLHTVEIPANPAGLVALSASVDHDYLAYPSPPRVANADAKATVKTKVVDTASGPVTLTKQVGAGTVGSTLGVASGGGSIETSVGSSQPRHGDVVVFDCKTLQPVSVIEAHKMNLSAIALSRDGTLLATASEKGTIIRVFSVERGVKLYQFRRGTYPTKIYSLAFSEDNEFVVASSATETVHVFRLGEEELANTKRGGRRAQQLNQQQNGDNNSSDDSDALDDENSLEAYDVLEPLPDNLERRKSSSSNNSGQSTESGQSTKMEPVVDLSRRSVARMLRRTSQSLGRKAAEKMGGYLPPRFSSILEPNRHFASLKVPASKDTTTIVGIGGISENLIPAVYMQDGTESSRTDTSIDSDLINKRVVHIMVVTSEGFFYTFGLDPDRGGDCVLLNQRSLLE
ncbi:DEKNAAC102357 [Brettanomyces naardenensis]|uniref:DEKNAAC102357 n=1 Tax=Brettanomyces naardenensis TaxID=13370 RepID=A0A448YKW8_BRENA|nr:DEKNAAC102357 [Brettanomyces naardenensis]